MQKREYNLRNRTNNHSIHLAVYSLFKSSQKIGIYHLGIIYDLNSARAREYNYGPNGGITSNEPGQWHSQMGGKFIKFVPIGSTKKNPAEFARRVDRKRGQFTAANYNFIAQNCHAFVQSMLQSDAVKEYDQRIYRQYAVNTKCPAKCIRLIKRGLNYVKNRGIQLTSRTLLYMSLSFKRIRMHYGPLHRLICRQPNCSVVLNAYKNGNKIKQKELVQMAKTHLNSHLKKNPRTALVENFEELEQPESRTPTPMEE